MKKKKEIEEKIERGESIENMKIDKEELNENLEIENVEEKRQNQIDKIINKIKGINFNTLEDFINLLEEFENRDIKVPSMHIPLYLDIKSLKTTLIEKSLELRQQPLEKIKIIEDDSKIVDIIIEENESISNVFGNVPEEIREIIINLYAKSLPTNTTRKQRNEVNKEIEGELIARKIVYQTLDKELSEQKDLVGIIETFENLEEKWSTKNQNAPEFIALKKVIEDLYEIDDNPNLEEILDSLHDSELPEFLKEIIRDQIKIEINLMKNIQGTDWEDYIESELVLGDVLEIIESSEGNELKIDLTNTAVRSIIERGGIETIALNLEWLKNLDRDILKNLLDEGYHNYVYNNLSSFSNSDKEKEEILNIIEIHFIFSEIINQDIINFYTFKSSIQKLNERTNFNEYLLSFYKISLDDFNKMLGQIERCVNEDVRNPNIRINKIKDPRETVQIKIVSLKALEEINDPNVLPELFDLIESQKDISQELRSFVRNMLIKFHGKGSKYKNS
jgi:hypothetical protein